MKQYQAALELNPDNYRANLLLGRMLALQDRPKEAIPLQQRAVKLEPQSADAHKFLGNVYAFRRRPAFSFRLLTSCIAHDVKVRVRSRYDWTAGKTLHHADRERFVSISESQAATVRSLR
jgi:tetratricopeptide (TPR) repeat protein